MREYWGKAETMICRAMASRREVVEAVAVAVIRYRFSSHGGHFEE
jgi:hypothetical protein